MQYLLKPLSEKEIAASLGLTYGTVHNYVTEIYRIYGVCSRFELIPLWLADVPYVGPHLGEQPVLSA